AAGPHAPADRRAPGCAAPSLPRGGPPRGCRPAAGRGGGGGEAAVGRVEVRTPGGAYPVLVGQGAMLDAPRVLRELGATRALLVTDDHVAPLWGDSFAQGLTGAGIHTETVTLPAGEAAKTFDQLRLLLGRLEKHRLDRAGFV